MRRFYSFVEMAAQSKVDHRKRVLLLAAIGVMIASRKKHITKKKQVKRFWRRGIFKDRKLHSEYYTLYQVLRETDREFHFRYVRMSKERFDHLLGLIREKISKKDTVLREAITAEERLVITLRYLASGMSQRDLCWSFRVGRGGGSLPFCIKKVYFVTFFCSSNSIRSSCAIVALIFLVGPLLKVLSRS